MDPRMPRLGLPLLALLLCCNGPGCNLTCGLPGPAPVDDDTGDDDTGDDDTGDDDTGPEDADGDGYPADEDCDDEDPSVHPGALEICNGEDDDCNGEDDDDCLDCALLVPDDHVAIADAIGAATTGDAICVRPGTYSEAIDLGGKDLHLLGIDGYEDTIIDGSDSDTVVTVATGETAAAVIEGFTISNGQAANGGGMRIDGASPTLRHLWLESSHATGAGGAIHMTGCDSLLDHVVITQNTAITGGGGIYMEDSAPILDHVDMNGCNADEGGGIQAVDSQPQIRNSVLAHNRAVVDGGGLWLSGSPAALDNVILGLNLCDEDGAGVYTATSAATFSNCAFVSNEADGSGGGAYVASGAPTFTNNVMLTNTSGSGGAYYTAGGSASITHGAVWDNTPDDYAGGSDLTGTNGNVSADPEFEASNFPSPSAWDLHLQTSSALIDAGSPSVQDPDGSTSDMGPFGGARAGNWDWDDDGYPVWWQPGPYDEETYPDEGWDCDDENPDLYPGWGC